MPSKAVDLTQGLRSGEVTLRLSCAWCGSDQLKFLGTLSVTRFDGLAFRGVECSDCDRFSEVWVVIANGVVRVGISEIGVLSPHNAYGAPSIVSR
jgi:hypothetical protein